jgi:hypothetical protein
MVDVRQLAHILKLSNAHPQKKGHGFGPSAVVGDCGEEVKGAPYGSTHIDTRVTRRREFKTSLQVASSRLIVADEAEISGDVDTKMSSWHLRR